MRSLLGRPADPASVPPPPMATPASPSGWDALRGRTKLLLLGSGAAIVIGFVMFPGMGRKPVAVVQQPEQHPPARIAEYDAPPAPAPDLITRISSNTGAMVDPPAAGGKRRRRVVPTEMAIFSGAIPVPAAAAPGAVAAVHATEGGAEGYEGGARPLGGAGQGGVGGGQGDKLSAAVSGATTLPTQHATLVRNADFLIRAGDKIPCLPVDAMDSSRAGFTTCTVPEWYRGTNQRRGLIPPGTRIFGQIRSGLANGETRLGVLYTQIQTPLFNMALAAPGADEMGRAGVNGDIHTFFWDKLGGVALYALMDVAVGAGQNVASSALSNAFGNGGTTLNLGSQSQTLASQQFQSTMNRPPILTRDQALPLTVSVGQDLDFTDACHLALQADPMACPLL